MKKSYSIYKMCRIAIMAAILVAVKEALAWLPNGELVTSIVCVGTLVFGWEMLLSTIIFSLIEIMLYGFGMWTVVYFYIWEILVIAVMLFKPIFKRNRILYTILMGVYGLLFGFFSAVPQLFIGGPKMAITWWMAGITFDLMHCAWNLVFGFLSFPVLLKIFEKSNVIVDRIDSAV